MAKKWKLYVWDDVLTDYTSGVMFAMATSSDEARRYLKEQCNYIPDFDLEKEPKEYPVTKLVGRVVWGGG